MMDMMPGRPSPDDIAGRRRDRPRRSPLESLITGLAVGAGFMAFWAFGGHQDWAIFVAFFGGLLPVARGVAGLVSARSSSPAAKKLGDRERALENERAVLRIAREKGGRLTPGIVALDCSMSIEEAESVLDGLAKKGHATIQVRDDGRIEYEFSEFMRLGD